MNEKQFCEYWCGPLTDAQRVMLVYKVERDEFLGVGRALGGMQFMPLVLIGKTPNVIDGAGYYQLASMDGRRGWSPAQEMEAMVE